MAGNQTNLPGAFLFFLFIVDIELFLVGLVGHISHKTCNFRQFAPNLVKSHVVTGLERMAVDTLSRYHFF